MIAKILALLFKLPYLKQWNQRRRRERYDFLKAKILERHFGGYRGMIVNFPGRRFDKFDFACFAAPMYFWVKNQDMHWVVFWDHGRMTKEVGTGKPLQPGEQIVDVSTSKRSEQAAADKVDEPAPAPVIITVATPQKDESSGGEDL